MKPEIKNVNSDLMLEELQEAIIAIESLEEYYLNSIKNVQEMKINTEKKYEIGLLIDDKLGEAMALKDFNAIQNAVNELTQIKLSNGIQVSEYITISCEKESEEEVPVISYSIKQELEINPQFVDPKNARREYNKVEQYENILVSSTLSNVIIIFERYLASVYEALILINPKKYFENQKIEIANIFNKNVRDIVVECVKKEVESNMFDSLKTLELISLKENININRYKNVLDEFEEIYYRRNLYIHNNGVVNNLYLSNIKDKFKKDIKVKQKLVTDEIYLRNAINMLYKIVCTLFYEVQLSYNPKYEKWHISLGNIGFDFLQDKNYDVAEQIYFILSSYKQLCFRDKAMYRINYINAVKQQGKTEIVKKELSELDVSIATDDYKIAKLCLEDKNAEVYEEISKNYPEPFTADLIRDWPLFINFRESEYYTLFVKEHQEDFGSFVFEFEELSLNEGDES
ncbi:hypothetical protein D7Y41_29400 [Anaerotruncus sp. 1XD22-93]|nr:hypothetical protein [Lachnospiraceae bacterium]NBI76425.1 hypothetical protein [Lachnospiraceae bacterium]RKJ78425.1 hypothetical protein D7Y41_29400 [Anaerotruncus sp. 1XD22-93]